MSKQQLKTMASESKGTMSLRSLPPVGQISFLHPDQPLDAAMRYLQRWGLVPVVSRADYQKLEGVISQRDVLDRYRAVAEM